MYLKQLTPGAGHFLPKGYNLDKLDVSSTYF